MKDASAASQDKSAIRDAASIVLLRDIAERPRILMGQRGAGAAFMPRKFVFPGGAVDAGDAHVPLAGPVSDPCARRLAEGGGRPDALAAAAIRELWEETGLMLGTPGAWPSPPADWQDFAAQGVVPAPQGLTYFFRAITPPGRPRRFDARFFLADAARVMGNPDVFGAAQEELANLQWIELDAARRLDLPFITEVVLAELAAMLERGIPPESVPFFDNAEGQSRFLRII